MPKYNIDIHGGWCFDDISREQFEDGFHDENIDQPNIKKLMKILVPIIEKLSNKYKVININIACFDNGQEKPQKIFISPKKEGK